MKTAPNDKELIEIIERSINLLYMIFLATPLVKSIILGCLFGGGILLMLIAIWQYYKQVKHVENTQHKLSDKELLLKFEAEPDGFLTVKRLMENSDLTKSEAKFRMTYLSYMGFLKTSYNSSYKSVYSLNKKLDRREIPELSNKPFLTVEDILKLFKTYDFQLSLQNMCIATGLPLSVIKKEMKYFEKEKVIESMTEYTADGMTGRKFWTLKEPYRSNPDKFLALETKMNLELEKLYDHNHLDEDYI